MVDGYPSRHQGIRRLAPVLSCGVAYAQDQRVRGRVIDYRCPIEFGNGVRVDPGDVIVGDIDGVLVIPSARADEIIPAALEKVEGEEAVRLMSSGAKDRSDLRKPSSCSPSIKPKWEPIKPNSTITKGGGSDEVTDGSRLSRCA